MRALTSIESIRRQNLLAIFVSYAAISGHSGNSADAAFAQRLGINSGVWRQLKVRRAVSDEFAEAFEKRLALSAGALSRTRLGITAPSQDTTLTGGIIRGLLVFLGNLPADMRYMYIFDAMRVLHEVGRQESLGLPLLEAVRARPGRPPKSKSIDPVVQRDGVLPRWPQAES